jgi:hypothetical protein
MSLITIIESVDTSNDLKNSFSSLNNANSISATYHRNTWLFGLIKTKPYIDLWIHDYLTDDASWNDLNLKITPQGNRLLVEFLSEFIEKHRKPFLFWSMWGGDEFGAAIINLNSAQFLELIEKSELSIKNKYRIQQRT